MTADGDDPKSPKNPNNDGFKKSNLLDDDNGPKRPKTLDEIKRDFEQKFRDEQYNKEIQHRISKFSAEDIDRLKALVENSATSSQKEKDYIFESIIKNSARNDEKISHVTANIVDQYLQIIIQKELEKEDFAKINADNQNSNTVGPKPAEQPTPESKKDEDALDAERLAQRAQINKADMERLAKSGPKRSNYEPLRHDEVQQRFGNPEAIAKYDRDDRNRTDAQKSSSLSPQTGSGAADTKKRGNGLMDDFVTAKTKKEDAEQTIQQQWKAAGKGMTRR